MEDQGEQPQGFLRAVTDLGAFLLELHRGVAEQRPEGQDLKHHAHEHAAFGVGVVPGAVFDPGQGFLLPASGGNAKRNRAFCPIHDPHGETHHENDDCDVREHDPEQRTHPHPHAQPRDDDERQYREKGVKRCHVPSPR